MIHKGGGRIPHFYKAFPLQDDCHQFRGWPGGSFLQDCANVLFSENLVYNLMVMHVLLIKHSGIPVLSLKLQENTSWGYRDFYIHYSHRTQNTQTIYDSWYTCAHTRAHTQLCSIRQSLKNNCKKEQNNNLVPTVWHSKDAWVCKLIFLMEILFSWEEKHITVIKAPNERISTENSAENKVVLNWDESYIQRSSLCRIFHRMNKLTK